MATHVTRWASDPYSFGAYSYVPTNSKRVRSAASLQSSVNSMQRRTTPGLPRMRSRILSAVNL